MIVRRTTREEVLGKLRAKVAGRRLSGAGAGRGAGAGGRTAFLMPMRGTWRDGIAHGPLHDPIGDRAFPATLMDALTPLRLRARA
jgi:hypothetical protein